MCYKMSLKLYRASALFMLLRAVAVVTAVASISATSSPFIDGSYHPPPPASNPSLRPAVPTEIVAIGSRRTITVFWKEIEETDIYIIAIRPKNGIEPLEWVEYSATSSPHSISSKLVMSDLEYELRLLAFKDNLRSEWSTIVSVSTPAIQPAPIDWNIVRYYVGDVIKVALGQRPFENRSTWHWFVCDADESDCKLLSVPSRTTYQYRVPEIARGKLIKVQVDYDKGGVSYSATDVIGMVSTTDRFWANVTNGRINVFWDEPERPSATSYRIRVRPKNGIQPLQWTENLATSLPHAILGYQVMSGLEYEIQLAPFNADQQSEWQQTTTVTVPDRQVAPAETINVITATPYRVGDVIQVSLASQHPFTSRSVWHWFLCDPDDSNCKLLPLKRTDTHKLLIPEMARGKLIKVQSDYRKDGNSYTAKATIGIVNAQAVDDFSRVNEPIPNPAVTDTHKTQCPEMTAPREDLFSITTGPQSHLYAMLLKFVTLQWDTSTAGGGAVEPMCDDLVVVTPRGKIAVIRPDGNLEYLDVRVPTNLDDNSEHPDASQVWWRFFRVADIMLKRHSQEHWELFVTHHYFTGECIRFRLSATTVIQDGNNIAVSPAWRTIFDAEPCMPLDYRLSNQAGGKMLSDGAEHLLIVTGDHRMGGRGNNLMIAQDPESHLGKLLRVETETGDVDILAYGLRNPQGFARDQYGNLWSTEHGPLAGDELNLLEPGNNYGWPLVSYGIDYEKRVIKTPEIYGVGQHDGFTTPVFSWIPSIAPSSIVVNNPQTFPLWKDDLLIATLTGTQGLSLYRVRRIGTEVQYFERIELGFRIRDLTQMPDGRIALLDDNGGVYFMSRDYTYCYDESLSDDHIYKVDCGP